ncbi:EAL domain-containing protein [Rhodoferax sp. BAB1]|uniref:sensor domain-containing protein n=1 Tax=Rhodoferax sp. BAB1 TaxID=2741720 RepID=UPI001575CD2B|nr:EAL domain-containing protein [Rhodoferax sp. BAB1]QKO23642.1 EAL domain-containing protein [Rhodoferax sp. BAB1]
MKSSETTSIVSDPQEKRGSAWRRVLDWLPRRSRPEGGIQVYRWVRLALYTVLVVVGALTYWQMRQQQQAEEIRQADAEIIRVAAAQSTLIQRMSMLLTRLQHDEGSEEEHVNALTETLNQTQTQATLLDELLARQGVWQLDDRPQLRGAIFEWQDRREKVWYRTQSLLWLIDQDNPARRLVAAQFLQTELESFWLTTQSLVDELQLAAQRRSGASMERIEFSGNFMLGVLLLLILAVAEPLVLFVRRQSEDLQQQSMELQRLALVAQRTSNWVAVVDRERRVLWCNEAFLRGKGSTLDEVLGQHAALLASNDYNDAEEMTRLLAELDMGLAARVDVMHRGRQGEEVWLDVDYQPIHDAQGLHTGFTLVARDITDTVNERVRMQTLLDTLPAGVVLQSAQGVVIECNRQAQEMLALPQQKLLGRDRLAEDNMVVRSDLTPYAMADRPSVRTLSSGRGLRGELVGHMRTAGELRWHMVNTEPMHDAAGHLTGVISCLVDVTQQREQQQLLTLAIESASLGVWQWDIPSGRMDVNDRLLSLFGYQPGQMDLTSDGFLQLIHPDDREGWGWAIRTNLRDSHQPLHWEVRMHHGSGRWMWTLFSGTVVARDGSGRALRMAGICYDINAQKELEEQLRQSARTDSLTRLPNRVELLGRIEASIQRTRQQPGYCFAVLFMDFDRFKQVNDTLGHSVGDELLRQIAKRLEDSLRPGDAFVQTSDFSQMAARIGGDEFVVLLDNIRGDLDAQVVAARLLEVLAEPYQIGPHRVSSTASIGIVTTAHMAEDPDSVLRDADIAMYEAKRQGRGRYEMFEPSMRKRVHDDVELENDLRQAIDKGEIHVVYQPMMDLGSGRLVGMEALARWSHPLRGPVSPLTFIPVAEATGVIGRLGEFVLKTACHELVRLRGLLGARAPETVSVNLSRAQLRQAGFTAKLSELLYSAGLAPGSLMLEVTESLAAQDEGMQAILREIRALGVSLSLDDFGTGYSSLSCLHELPVNQVKIDRSFVSQALTSNYHRVMIDATISMARTLGLQTVAEGIETAEQAALMAELGCGKGQGYLYSRPLSARDLESWALAMPAAALRT